MADELTRLRDDLDRLRTTTGDGDPDRIVDVVERIAAHPQAADEFWMPELLWELDEALRRWPEIAEAWEGDDRADYDRALQGHLLEFAASGAKPTIAPLTVAGLVAYAAERGEDPRHRHTRAAYAAEVARTGGAIAWPPGRNEPCWCRSGTKYERCCGTVTRPTPASGS